MEAKKFLSAEEVSTEFGLDANALQGLVDSGDLRALADRGTWKYRRDELEALVSSGKIDSPNFSLDEGNSSQTIETVEYMELDEAALDQKGTRPVSDHEQDWFVPSEVPEMTEAREKQSSSDVTIVPETSKASEPSPLGKKSDSDVVLMPGTKTADRIEDVASAGIASDSDSDVRIADQDSPKTDDSGITLDVERNAGATVSSSGSSKTSDSTDSDVVSPVGKALSDDSGLTLDDSSIEPASDSDVQLVSGSSIGSLPGDSGIMIDGGSAVGRGSSVLAGPPAETDDDSAITVKPDSGISLEDKHDSGITVAGDSGISLSAGDSGISLSAGDSGISLGAPDSGLSLHSAGDSGISLEGDSGIGLSNSKTLSDADVFDGDSNVNLTKTLELSTHDEDSTEDMAPSDMTMELLLDDEDQMDETSATVVRKGRGGLKPKAGLSDSFDLEETSEVEDLEISSELDSGIDEEIEEFAEEEAVLDASDEVFSDEVETAEEEDYLEPAAARKPAKPREPAWGGGVVAGLIAGSLFMAVNVLVMASGMSSMWNGSEALGPAAPLIDTLGGIIPR